MIPRFTLTLFCAVLFVGCGKFSYTAKISRDQIQTKVDDLFPVDLQESADLPFPAELSAAQVVLEESADVIGLRVTFTTDPPSPPGGAPPAPKPPPFAPPGAPAPPAQPPPVGEPINGTLSVTGEVSYDAETCGFFFKNPQVEQPESSELPAELAEPLSRAAAKIVGTYLDKNPIYTLDDSKLTGKLAKALLRSVEIKNGELQVRVGL